MGADDPDIDADDRNRFRINLISASCGHRFGRGANTPFPIAARYGHDQATNADAGCLNSHDRRHPDPQRRVWPDPDYTGIADLRVPAPQQQGTGDNADRTHGHGGTCNLWTQIAQGRQGQAHDIIEKGPEQIVMDFSDSTSTDIQGRRNQI